MPDNRWPRPGAQHTLKWLGPCEMPMSPPPDAPSKPKYRDEGESSTSTAEVNERKEIHAFHPEKRELNAK